MGSHKKDKYKHGHHRESERIESERKRDSGDRHASRNERSASRDERHRRRRNDSVNSEKSDNSASSERRSKRRRKREYSSSSSSSSSLDSEDSGGASDRKRHNKRHRHRHHNHADDRSEPKEKRKEKKEKKVKEKKDKQEKKGKRKERHKRHSKDAGVPIRSSLLDAVAEMFHERSDSPLLHPKSSDQFKPANEKVTTVSSAPTNTTSDGSSGHRRAMVPQTKQEHEKQESVFREVYDPLSGRTRLVKGSGEIMERIVSRDQQRAINKTSTQTDGAVFSAFAANAAATTSRK
ncbi:nuclear RNA-splicing-associated protein-domain-containing protein [Cladochytrium replicatum]|nr:nuclear RNA-splicing-associated protein-domain-containing protein [Cladochytrium replicatum]